MEKRIDYIDILKGLTILGVILVHSGGHPDWFTANHVNTIFFFLAGIFFKPRPIKEFVKRNLYSLIIPFLFFFLISYPFRLLVNYWDTRNLAELNWMSIFDLFEINTRSDYLYVNVPLWFLLCLFMVQMIYWSISHLPIWGRWLSIGIIFIISEFVQTQVPTPFMINNAVHYTLYFGLGSLLGSYLLKWFGNNSQRIIIIGLSMILVIASYWCMTLPGMNGNVMLTNIHFIGYSICCMGLCSFLNGVKMVSWLKFFGVNTLIILCAHVIILTPINRTLYMAFNHNATIMMAVLDTAICAVIMIPVILFINRYLPLVAGKGLKHGR